MKIFHYKNSGYILIICIFILMTVGLISVFSTTFLPLARVSREFYNQTFFYAIGLVLFFTLSYINLDLLKNKYMVFLIFFVQLVLLLVVLGFGVNVGDARRWIAIAGFTIQPAEFVKISLVLITSFLMVNSRSKNSYKTIESDKFSKKNIIIFFKKILKTDVFLRVLLSFGVFFIFITLIFFQKSLGNTLVISLLFLLLFLFNIKIRKKTYSLFFSIFISIATSIILFLDFENGNIVFIFLCSILVLSFVTRFLRGKFLLNFFIFLLFLPTTLTASFFYSNILLDYQKNRIESFLNSSEDTFGTNWNRTQSLNAFGSGRFFGKGFMNGEIVNNQLLPFPFTDFAFASLGEQFGFIGSIAILFTYLVLFIVILRISYRTNDSYLSSIAYGFLLFLFLNFTQHVGMNIGLLPITGMTLPLISYGGSSVISVLIALGIINNIHKFNLKQEDGANDLRKKFF